MNEKTYDELQQQVAVEAALAADREAALRDVFAASALGALIAIHCPVHSTAEEAYLYADAMMKARKEQHGEYEKV